MRLGNAPTQKPRESEDDAASYSSAFAVVCLHRDLDDVSRVIALFDCKGKPRCLYVRLFFRAMDKQAFSLPASERWPAA